MASFNRIIMAGNLTKDPELKQIGAGQSVCRLTIASNRQFKNRQTGVMAQEVCYIDVDVWGAQAESTNQYLRKGSSILIEGRLRYDSWKDAEGNNRYRHAITADRVVFLGGRGDSDTAGVSDELNTMGGYESTPAEQPREKKPAAKKSKEEPTFKNVSPFEEDLPF